MARTATAVQVRPAPAPPRRRVSRPSAPPVRLWTAEELLALPDDGHRYELVRGRLITMTPASARHGKLAARLVGALLPFVEAHDLGEVYTAEPGFTLESDPDTVRAPDVAFVRRERIPPEGEPEGFWAIAPDLVIEIVSPSESAHTVQAKVADYLRAGTRLLWVVYPDSRTVMEFRAPDQARLLTAEDHLEGGEVVPGFS
ncbi:MAG TPA: Uma2 family endonuclease, partial [Anaerolineae bacterium]|nr:Uma2 family endonuclease [Anaerolineae bacterium]